MTYARIVGTGSYLPERRLSNAELATQIETTDEWIVSRTGIRARHVAADDQKTSDLAYHAALKAIEAAGIDRESIDLIIVATTTPDMIFPSTACILQDKLGLPGRPAFDVQAVCAGFIYALSTANAYIRSGMAKTVLVVGAEIFSRILDWSDRGTCVLFGDGAGAVMVTASDTPGILAVDLHADGRFQSILNVPAHVAHGELVGQPFLRMDGGAVFKFAVKALAECASTTLAAQGMDKADLDWLVPHQANLRIIEATAKHLHLPMEKVVVTLPEQGNTSAASIPLALDAAVRDGRIQAGHKVMLEGIGGGFAWGAVLLEM
mgnify:FL=1